MKLRTFAITLLLVICTVFSLVWYVNTNFQRIDPSVVFPWER